ERDHRQSRRGRARPLRDGPAVRRERVPVPAVDPGAEAGGRRRAVSGVGPDYDLDAWRGQIPLLASCIPMNNCSQAPQTVATRAAAERYLDSWNERGMDWYA